MRTYILTSILFFIVNTLFSQNDSTTLYATKYLAEIHNVNLSTYSGAVVILNLGNCGKGTICGSRLEKFTASFSAISKLNKLVVLLGSDTTIEKNLNGAQNLTIIHSNYDQARLYGLGLALHHLFLLKEGTFILNTIPTAKNYKKTLRTFKKFHQ